MFVGFTSVLTDGLAPGKDHRKEKQFREMFVKSVQVPGQIWFGALKSAMGLMPRHGATDGLSSASVYNLMSSSISSVQSLQMCPQFVNLIVWLVEVAINSMIYLVPTSVVLDLVCLHRKSVSPKPTSTPNS